MITGFNTDIDFQGTTYHVQTEDKGLATPFVLSLVYQGGTILASKRSAYDDLVKKGFDEKILVQRLQKQHKTICAAIRAGRIEDLKRMNSKQSARNVKKPVELPNNAEKPPVQQTNGNLIPEISPPEIAAEKPLQTEKMPVVKVYGGIETISASPTIEAPIPKPDQNFSIKHQPEIDSHEPIIEAVEIIEDVMILPAEAVEIVGESGDTGKISDNKLKLEILGDENFKSGEKKTISILVHRGDRENGLGGAQVMVKVLGASFRPQIFHGKAAADGIAKVHLQMPLFKQGRAAILIKAMIGGEETELRRTIKHK